MITLDDIEFINLVKDKSSLTKFEAFKLQTIWNKVKTIKDDYCMCTDSQRNRYKQLFFIFWNQIKNDYII